MKRLAIVVPCTGETLARSFFESFIEMTSFPVLKELQEKYGVEAAFMVNKTFPIDRNRNETVELCLERYAADYILFLDNDQTFPKDTLLRLFECLTDEYKVISGCYWKKHPPFSSVLGHYCTDITSDKVAILAKLGLVTKEGQQCLYYAAHEDFTHERPFEIDISGMGCLLVDTSVFKRLEMPYFKYFDRYQYPDWPNNEGTSEEMFFFAKLKQAGIKVRCTPKVLCGHLREAEIVLLGGSASCV